MDSTNLVNSSEAGGAQSPSPRVDIRQRLRQALKVLWRGKKLILACVVLGLAPTILYLTQATPQYSTTVKLMIEGGEASQLVTMERVPMIQPRPSEQLVASEAEVLSSSLLLRRVVDKLGLEHDPEFNVALREPKALEIFIRWFNPISWLPDSLTKIDDGLDKLSVSAKTEIAKARVVAALARQVKIQFQRRSFVVGIQVTAEGREKAALIANTLATLYVNESLEASLDDAKRVSGWLGERLEALRHDVNVAESAAEQYRSTYSLRRKGERQGTMTDQQLSELSSRLVIARTDLAQKQARLEQVRNLMRTSGAMDSSMDVLQSQLIQRLREQEAGIQRSISESTKIYGERHPKLVGYHAELAELRGKINAEIGKIASSVANEVSVASTGVHTLEGEIDVLRRQTNVAGEAEVKLRELERQAEVSRGLYEAFLSRFKRDIDQEQVQRAKARIISPATIPVSPSAPRKVAILLLMTVLSFGFGVALVFLLDRLDNAVRSADECEDMIGLPTLAVVPTHTIAAANVAEELAARPRSAFADAIRSLRVTLSLRDEGCTGPRVVMVTSSEPREGKSFVALSLTAALAKIEPQILLIDGDMHKPKQHTALGVSGDIGLAQVLAGTVDAHAAIQRGVVQNVDFLPAGKHPMVADLATEAQVHALLEQLKSYYDIIVVDLPPVLAVSDPRIFARFADRLIYLVRWNSTSRAAINNGLKLLRDANITAHGIVLSQADPRKYSRYSYGDYGNYYGRYKEYYSE